MIQLSSLPAAIPHGPVRPAAPAVASGGFVLPGEEAAAEASNAIVAPGRQILAAPGKALPELDLDAETPSEEETKDGEDIAFAWFSLPVAPTLTPPTPLGTAPRAVVGDFDGAEGEALPALPIAGDGTGTETAKPEADVTLASELKSDLAQAEAEPEPAPVKLPVAMPATQPAPIEIKTTTAQLAAALFAAVPAAATPAETRRTFVQDLLPVGASTAFADIVRPHAVAAAADVQQGMLDMRRQEWMGQMVEHIEAMRDASPTRETRLSLSPEGLGKVDVSIRQDGDRIHVHFATETQAARQLIADAQPRLGELAEARGLKLGHTSFESGTAGQGAHRESRGNPASQQPLAPPPDFSDSAVGTADDERIA